MSTDALRIREARVSDVPEMLAIYGPIVEHTATSFEVTAPTVDEFAGRVHKYGQDWGWLVAERRGAVVGYAYASPHRERPAYRWSVETSVYVSAAAYRQGIGRSLYLALLPRLAAAGFCNAYAGVTLPNEASVALHRSVGFLPIGVFPSVGRKFDVWHDVAWLHRPLRPLPP